MLETKLCSTVIICSLASVPQVIFLTFKSGSVEGTSVAATMTHSGAGQFPSKWLVHPCESEVAGQVVAERNHSQNYSGTVGQTAQPTVSLAQPDKGGTLAKS